MESAYGKFPDDSDSQNIFDYNTNAATVIMELNHFFKTIKGSI